MMGSSNISNITDIFDILAYLYKSWCPTYTEDTTNFYYQQY